jgi:hypothetical protein
LRASNRARSITVKGRKRKDSAGENVEAYRHETETRKNAVPVRLASYDTSTPKPKKYEYNPTTSLNIFDTTYCIH